MRIRFYLLCLIAVVVTAVMVSCGGADITGSGSSYSRGDTGGNTTTDTNTNTNLPDDNYTLPNDNPSDYYRIRVPFGVNSGEGYIDVSYKE